jgi:large subunit ribosomal protein L9
MPSHKVKVRLIERIANLGKAGEIIEVSSVQARNYLIPKGLASEVSDKDIASLADAERRKRENANTLILKKHEIQETLHAKTLGFGLRGKGSKIFGGVSEHDIAERIEREFGYPIEKSHVRLPEGKHLKTVGDHDIHINLGHEVFIRMTISIHVEE